MMCCKSDIPRALVTRHDQRLQSDHTLAGSLLVHGTGEAATCFPVLERISAAQLTVELEDGRFLRRKLPTLVKQPLALAATATVRDASAACPVQHVSEISRRRELPLMSRLGSFDHSLSRGLASDVTWQVTKLGGDAAETAELRPTKRLRGRFVGRGPVRPRILPGTRARLAAGTGPLGALSLADADREAASALTRGLPPALAALCGPREEAPPPPFAWKARSSLACSCSRVVARCPQPRPVGAGLSLSTRARGAETGREQVGREPHAFDRFSVQQLRTSPALSPQALAAGCDVVSDLVLSGLIEPASLREDGDRPASSSRPGRLTTAPFVRSEVAARSARSWDTAFAIHAPPISLPRSRQPKRALSFATTAGGQKQTKGP